MFSWFTLITFAYYFLSVRLNILFVDIWQWVETFQLSNCRRNATDTCLTIRYFWLLCCSEVTCNKCLRCQYCEIRKGTLSGEGLIWFQPKKYLGTQEIHNQINIYSPWKTFRNNSEILLVFINTYIEQLMGTNTNIWVRFYEPKFFYIFFFFWFFFWNRVSL